MVLPAIEAVDTIVASEIEESLLAELRQRFDQGHNTPITLTIKADDEKFIAGLGGSTAYGWLLIKTLWVAPKWRGQGFGRALVMDAMKRAAALQCHGVWLVRTDEAIYSIHHWLSWLCNLSHCNSVGRQRYYHCQPSEDAYKPIEPHWLMVRVFDYL